MTKKYLTVIELAKYLGVARRSIYNYMDLGMPSIKLGGSRRFEIKEVEKWIKR